MISGSEQIDRVRQALPFLATKESPFSHSFFKHASLITAQKNQHICLEGGECQNLALLLNGTARIYKLGENGKEITLYRIGEGESCILTASCILSGEPFPAYAVCEKEVTAVVISALNVKQWLAKHSIWRDYIFGLISHRLSNIISVVEEVVFRRMDARIAQYLIDATPNSASVQTTHQVIASDLGTSREVVSRILKDLEQAEFIQINRGNVTILDRENLRKKTASS